MTSKTWVVDPGEHWKQEHIDRFPEANLPDTPRCEATLTSKRCELIADHDGAHVILLHPLDTLKDAVKAEHPEIDL